MGPTIFLAVRTISKPPTDNLNLVITRKIMTDGRVIAIPHGASPLILSENLMLVPCNHSEHPPQATA